MGYQYAGLLLSLVASLAIPLPYILFKYGEKIRAKSKYAANDADLEAERVSDDENQNDARPTITREGTYTGQLV